jgi:hypothetical protein
LALLPLFIVFLWILNRFKVVEIVLFRFWEGLIILFYLLFILFRLGIIVFRLTICVTLVTLFRLV